MTEQFSDADPGAVRSQARADAFGAAADMLDAHLASEGYDLDCPCDDCPICTVREYRDLLTALAVPGA